MPQKELSDAASINRTYLSKLETARTYAGLEVIEKFDYGSPKMTSIGNSLIRFYLHSGFR
jgi:hypothetical protein